MSEQSGGAIPRRSEPGQQTGRIGGRERQAEAARTGQAEAAGRVADRATRPGGGANQVADIRRLSALVDTGEDPGRPVDSGELAGRDEGELSGPDEAPPGVPPTDGGDDGAGDGEAGEGGQAGPLTLAGVAERLGITNKELNAVEVAVGADRMTLGELKAKLPELAKFERARVDFEDERSTWQLKHVDEHRRLLALVDAIPPHLIPPAFVQRVQAQRIERNQRESELLTTARPEWADPVQAQNLIKGFAKRFAKYGFSVHELAAVGDHRQLLFMQDMAALVDRVEKAKQQAARLAGGSGGSLAAEGAPRAVEPQRKAGRLQRENLGAAAARLIG